MKKTTIKIKGTIVSNDQKEIYDYFGIDSFCPKDLVLPEDASPICVEINSGGGSVFDGSEIYTALKAYQGSVEVVIAGLAASAASFIAMAGDRVAISPTAQMMIHSASTYTEGNHVDMTDTAKRLSGVDKSIANAYLLKTNKSLDDILVAMTEETWFTAQEAVDFGLADEVLFADDEVYLASNQAVLSKAVIDEFRQAKLNDGVAQRFDNLEKQFDSLKTMLVAMAKDNADMLARLNQAQTAADKKQNSPFGKFI